MKKIKYLFWAILLLFFGYFIVGEIVLPGDKLDSKSSCREFVTNWTYTDAKGNVTKDFAIPNKLTDDVGYLETVVPEDLGDDVSCMCFRAKDFKAYLDNQLILEYDTQNSRWFGQASPESYVMIPLSSKDVGKTLRLELSPLTGIIYQPYVGSDLGVWIYLLQLYAKELVVAIITLVLGFLTIGVSIIYGAFKKKKIELAYLGGGVVLAAFWLIFNSIFRQVLFPNVSVASDSPFLMVMLIPFPFLIYMNEVQEKRNEKLYQFDCLLLGLIDLTCAGLYAFGIKELTSTFIFVALGCFISIASIFVTMIIDIRNKRIKEYSSVAIGLVGAFLSAIVQLVTYFNRTGVFSGYVLAIGLIILLFGAAIHTVKLLSRREQNAKAAIIANEAKGKFLFNMSHEIRTPINAVIGMNEMILREAKEPEIRDYAFDIQNASKSLLALINDILDMSKIDSGKLEIIPVEYDVSSLIHDTVNMISHKAKGKNLSVGLQIDPEIPATLLGDDIRIRQVLINILNNAIKYTHEGGVTLAMKGERVDGHYVLHVEIEDTGIGIKEEDMPKLFEEFQRIEENRNRNIEGTGLGMTITVQLLNLMGSRIQVRSEYGKGSCFYFDLQQEVVDETPIGNLSERIKNQESEYTYETAFTAPEAEVLVVDDNAVNRKVLRNLLKDTLVRIDEADSGEECLDMTEEKKYDLIFLDYMMPGLDGIETLAELRSREKNPNVATPTVALTANAVSGAKEMYLSHGFDAFLSKPIVFDKLEKALLEFLPEDKINEEIVAAKANEEEQAEDNEELKELLESLPEINLEYAYLYNGNAEELYSVMLDFVHMMISDADTLEGYAVDLTDEENLKQYRVKVHSMKSSAAMIGAIHLSGMARMLEVAAINEDVEAINSVTLTFLKEWRSYRDKLEPIILHEKTGRSEEDLIEVNVDILVEQLDIMNEAMAELDVDRADAIVELLKEFAYPDTYADKMEELYVAVANLDDAKAAELVEEIKAFL